MEDRNQSMEKKKSKSKLLFQTSRYIVYAGLLLYAIWIVSIGYQFGLF